MNLSQWEHTSTAFGVGQGCNFKVRAGSRFVSGERLQKTVYDLSRIIDHRCLEKDFAFFESHSPSLENIAQFLLQQLPEASGIDWVEVDGNDNLRARAGDHGTQIFFTFTARDARRVFNVEVQVEGSVERGHLEEVLRRGFHLPEIVSLHGLDNTFSALKATLLPQKLNALTVTDALENTVILRLPAHDTSPAPSQHLHL